MIVSTTGDHEFYLQYDDCLYYGRSWVLSPVRRLSLLREIMSSISSTTIVSTTGDHQNIDNSECFGVTFVKNLSRNDFIIIFGKNMVLVDYIGIFFTFPITFERWLFCTLYNKYNLCTCILLICEREWALYGIKCVLRIFWQTWLDIVTNKKKFDAL